MLYSQEERNKIHNNLDQITAYLTELQPCIRQKIVIDFGEMKTYVSGEREQEFHISISRTDISGRSGALGLAFTKEKISSSVCSTPYQHLDYAVGLCKEWPRIKKALLAELAKQQSIIATINKFKI